MRKIAICALLAVFATCNSASANVWANNYKDIRRTGGHKRSAAAFRVDLRACAKVAGIPYNADMPDPPAFKACMLKRGLQWQSTRRNTAKPAPAPQQRTGWHNGVCRYDCDNPEAPGSGYTCQHYTIGNMAYRKCAKQN
jgi:hypothetical protein